MPGDTKSLSKNEQGADAMAPARSASKDRADAELSQAEIEALLTQAGELTSDGEQAAPAKSPKSKSQAAKLADASVFGSGVPADMPSLEPSMMQDKLMSEEQALELLGDVPIDISIELGKVRLTIGELINLRSGAVIDLDRLVGESVDVLANGTIIARGEVVVVNEYYSVRVTEIVSED